MQKSTAVVVLAKNIVSIFAGRHYSGMGSSLQKLLGSLEEAKYSNSYHPIKLHSSMCISH